MTERGGQGVALLVVDMQNGFLHPDGSTAQALEPLPRGPEVIAACASLVAATRERGVPVMFTRHRWRDLTVDAPERIRRLYPPGIQPLIQGTWDAEILDELTPVNGDIVIDKSRFDAFLNTDLDLLLRSLGTKRLLVCGVLTHICVETTVRSASQRDYDAYVAADATSAPEPLHSASLTCMERVFAHVGDGRAMLAQALQS
jgi:ureidoacrylate peracid hydrolase